MSKFEEVTLRCVAADKSGSLEWKIEQNPKQSLFHPKRAKANELLKNLYDLQEFIKDGYFEENFGDDITYIKYVAAIHEGSLLLSEICLQEAKSINKR